jgi:hypothetical protein
MGGLDSCNTGKLLKLWRGRNHVILRLFFSLRLGRVGGGVFGVNFRLLIDELLEAWPGLSVW